MYRIHHLPAAGILTLLAAAPMLGQAQNDVTLETLLAMPLEDLSTYRVSAPTTRPMSVREAPGAVSVITYDQIQRSGAMTIPALLRGIPGVNIRWNPMVQTIDIRGFGSNPFTSRVLLLIDGIPYNSWNKGGFPQHPGFDFFDLTNVKHLEVVRGPGSALYGENAFNGVINIVTLSGKEIKRTRVGATTGPRNTRMLSVSHGTGSETVNGYFSARFQRSQLPTALWENSDAESYNLFARVDVSDWQFSLYHLRDVFNGYSDPVAIAGLPPGEFGSADSIEQDVTIAAAQYEHTADDERWSFRANASFSKRDGSHCTACHSPNTTPEFNQSADHGHQNFVKTHLAVALSETNELLVGAEVRDIDSGDHSEELLGSDLVPGHSHGMHHSEDSVLSYRKHALFMQDELILLDERLRLTAGLRYESATSPRLFTNNLFPRFAAVLQASQSVTVRAGWGRAARYPSFSELYQSSNFLVYEAPGLALPLAVFEANPDLGPEFIESIEMGVDWRPDARLHGSINVFRNRISNAIGIAYPRFSWENHPADAIVTGGEMDIRYRHDDTLTISANWSYQRNRQRGDASDSAGSPIDFSYAPRHKVNLSIAAGDINSLSAVLDVHWKDEYDAPDFWYPIAFPTDPNPRPLPAYAIVNSKVRWRLPFTRGDGDRPMSLHLTGRNLLDEEVFETLTGFGGRIAGRELFVGVDYRFAQ